LTIQKTGLNPELRKCRTALDINYLPRRVEYFQNMFYLLNLALYIRIVGSNFLLRFKRIQNFIRSRQPPFFRR